MVYVCVLRIKLVMGMHENCGPHETTIDVYVWLWLCVCVVLRVKSVRSTAQPKKLEIYLFHEIIQIALCVPC